MFKYETSQYGPGRVHDLFNGMTGNSDLEKGLKLSTETEKQINDISLNVATLVGETGHIKNTVSQHGTWFGKVFEELKDINKNITEKPCKEHSTRFEALKEKLDSYNGLKREIKQEIEEKIKDKFAIQNERTKNKTLRFKFWIVTRDLIVVGNLVALVFMAYANGFFSKLFK